MEEHFMTKEYSFQMYKASLWFVYDIYRNISVWVILHFVIFYLQKLCKLYLFSCKTCLHDAMHCNLHVPPIEWRQLMCQKLTPWLKPRRNQCHLALVIWRIATQGQHSNHVMGWWRKPTLWVFPALHLFLVIKLCIVYFRSWIVSIFISYLFQIGLSTTFRFVH